LPNYDVFDEKRYFTPGDESSVFEIDGYKIGVNICEDIWVPQICKEQRNKGANLIINISASPFHIKKWKQREELLSKRAKEINLPIIYANLVGGQDDLVFDGRSYFFNNEGKKISEAKSFEEDLVEIDLLEKEFPNPNQNPHETEKETKEIYEALILGLKDYVQKNGFKKVIIGLSGGIDSALTAAIAVKALGKENVLGITMPSKFSSKGSVDDSIELAKNLEINCETIPIKDAYDTYLNSLYNQFLNTEVNVAEENIQARIRGNFLMAISNKFNYLVLSTGNKSELSVGYATLYGDMCGGIAVISDLLKTKVYNLCKYINNISNRKIIPLSIIEKEPSAELREDQKDTDSLPPYDVLDSILESYVEEDKSTEEIIGQGYDPETVKRIIKLVDRNEYKRNQAAIGIKITPRAFGSGRRMPITNRWND